MRLEDDVKAFREKFGFPVSAVPTVPTHTVVVERIRMLKEELSELEEALHERSLPRIGLEAVDLIYVALGTLVSCGLKLEPFWERVHAANMAKTKILDFDGEPGKPGKPSGWAPPDGVAATNECWTSPAAANGRKLANFKLLSVKTYYPNQQSPVAPELESEPPGYNTGIKHDSAKPRMELLPFDALEAVARVLAFGAVKYGPDNWRRLKDLQSRYGGALLRHYAAIQRGEQNDPETGEPHLAHLACCALFMLGDHVSRNETKVAKEDTK